MKDDVCAAKKGRKHAQIILFRAGQKHIFYMLLKRNNSEEF